jgi:putative transcriptional regulator
MRHNLKESREKHGFTQAEMAMKLGIARTTYTNIELGTKDPSFRLAFRIKKLLKAEDEIFLSINVPDGNNKRT